MTKDKFLKQIEGTQFQADLGNDIQMNGKPMARGIWNLLLSKRDCRMFSRGIKPHRNWKLRDVKWYFGIAGGKEKCLAQLESYMEILDLKAG